MRQSTGNDSAFELRCEDACPARKLALGLAVVAVAACVILWLFVVLSINKKKRRPASSTLSRYSYSELDSASQGIDNHSNGGVSRCNLLGGSAVVVKSFPVEGLIKESAFTSEIEIISKISHENLLHLRGFCYEDGRALLLYDYASFCLQDLMYGSHDAIASVNGHVSIGVVDGSSLLSTKVEVGPRRLLNGNARLKILKGVCAALVHLHENCILHRDVRAANVFLTQDLEPRLGGCGVARLTALKRGAKLPPYVAPEAAYTGKVTEKADVFSFGVLALEVVSGRNVEDGPFHLIEWAWMLYQSNQLMSACDPACAHDVCGSESAISCSANMDSVWKCVLHVALFCCHPLMEARPTMRQVSMALQENIVLHLPAEMPFNALSWRLGQPHLPSV